MKRQTIGDWRNGEKPSDEKLTATQALARWDEGLPVWTIEMGGIGPGYEQAIQVAAFELIRELSEETFPKDVEPLNKLFDDALHEIEKRVALGGLSGAQAGAAKNLAYVGITKGWTEMLKDVPKDRQILVSKHWPGKA